MKFYGQRIIISCDDLDTRRFCKSYRKFYQLWVEDHKKKTMIRMQEVNEVFDIHMPEELSDMISLFVTGNDITSLFSKKL